MTAYDIRIARERESCRRRERKNARKRNRTAAQRGNHRSANAHLRSVPPPVQMTTNSTVANTTIVRRIFDQIKSRMLRLKNWLLSPWELPRMV